MFPLASDWSFQVAAEVPRVVHGPLSILGSASEAGSPAPAEKISYFSPESIASRPRKARSLLSLCINQIGEVSVLINEVTHSYEFGCGRSPNPSGEEFVPRSLRYCVVSPLRVSVLECANTAVLMEHLHAVFRGRTRSVRCCKHNIG